MWRPGFLLFFRMNELGERFVFGSDEPQQYLKLCGFQCVHAVNVQDYLV